jgi:DNA-binding LacI/PurR family transcriptional regulator
MLIRFLFFRYGWIRVKRTAARSTTLRDVAREAGVSIASASRVINGLDTVTDEMRTLVLETAARLRYVPNSGARSLVTKRTNTIGVLLPDTRFWLLLRPLLTRRIWRALAP